jgi:hypothetical protein
MNAANNSALPSASMITIINAVGRPEDFVQSGIANKPGIVLNPVMQNARNCGAMRTMMRGAEA